MRVSDFTTNDASTPPKLTLFAPERFLPVMTTAVPGLPTVGTGTEIFGAVGEGGAAGFVGFGGTGGLVVAQLLYGWIRASATPPANVLPDTLTAHDSDASTRAMFGAPSGSTLFVTVRP